MQHNHTDKIIEQFTRQAIPFANLPGHLDALDLLLELTQPNHSATVLDVACGPGLVACAIAHHARWVTGIDITPVMIKQARRRQQEQGLDNIEWVVGDALPLPWIDNSFSLVITRYSFHHFQKPHQVLAEMIRVCSPGGQVLVADVAMDPSKVVAYDRLELIRDPSHTHALTTKEFADLFLASGLTDCRQAEYKIELNLEAQLAASFPAPGGKELLREMVTTDIGSDALGINARHGSDGVRYTVPIGVFIGKKRG